MLTKEDIQKIVEIVATKDNINDLREDIDGLKKSIQSLIAKKLGIKLEY